MTFVSPFERFTLEKGRKLGREEGLRFMLVRLLTRRFGELPAPISAQLQALKQP